MNDIKWINLKWDIQLSVSVIKKPTDDFRRFLI
jgi:hypothetical protein